MNRKTEYYKLLEELENDIPELQSSVEKARARRKRSYIGRTLASTAACFAAFVLLVNFCTPVAYACSNVPILRELAAAVTFSRSLSDAVENEYVQEIDRSQTQNEITAEIAYLIVDQKQVNVFYRLKSDRYDALTADPQVLTEDGASPEACSYHSNGFQAADGELRSMTVEFIDGSVPSKLRVLLNVYSVEQALPDKEPTQSADAWELPPETENYLASFDFLLEFDPEYTASGTVIPVNSTVEMDGQSITVTQIEIYPTHIRVNIEEQPDNTCWLKNLDFYIETDHGMRFEPVSNGLSAVGDENSPAMLSYRADSSYFYEAEHIKLIITGARWLRKDMERVHVDLLTGKTDKLPDGVSFESAEKNGATWTVTFRAGHNDGEPLYQLFSWEYYDAQGKAYMTDASAANYGQTDENGKYTYYLECFPLRDYPYDEVWLCPLFSYSKSADSEISIIVK